MWCNSLLEFIPPIFQYPLTNFAATMSRTYSCMLELEYWITEKVTKENREVKIICSLLGVLEGWWCLAIMIKYRGLQVLWCSRLKHTWDAYIPCQRAWGWVLPLLPSQLPIDVHPEKQQTTVQVVQLHHPQEMEFLDGGWLWPCPSLAVSGI